MLKTLILLSVHLISLCCPVLFQAPPIDSLNRTSIYIIIYVPFDRGPIWSREGPFKRARANVGPASNVSKVNNIALKTATLVSRFS